MASPIAVPSSAAVRPLLPRALPVTKHDKWVMRQLLGAVRDGRTEGAETLCWGAMGLEGWEGEDPEEEELLRQRIKHLIAVATDEHRRKAVPEVRGIVIVARTHRDRVNEAIRSRVEATARRVEAVLELMQGEAVKEMEAAERGIRSMPRLDDKTIKKLLDDTTWEAWASEVPVWEEGDAEGRRVYLEALYWQRKPLAKAKLACIAWALRRLRRHMAAWREGEAAAEAAAEATARELLQKEEEAAAAATERKGRRRRRQKGRKGREENGQQTQDEEAVVEAEAVAQGGAAAAPPPPPLQQEQEQAMATHGPAVEEEVVEEEAEVVDQAGAAAPPQQQQQQQERAMARQEPAVQVQTLAELACQLEAVVLEEREGSASLEEHLSCPISLLLMTDPVVAEDGNTYQRQAIQEWFDRCTTEGKPATSPLTGLTLRSTELRANHLVRSLVRNRMRTAAGTSAVI